MTLLYGKRADTEKFFDELFPQDDNKFNYYEKCRKINEYMDEKYGDSIICIFRRGKCYLCHEPQDQEFVLSTCNVPISILHEDYKCLSKEIYIIAQDIGDMDLN
jgi:hypothetical protein